MGSERRSDEELARMRQISEQLPDDLEGLEVKLSDPDHLVRMLTAMKMGQVEDANAVKLLLQALEDEHHEVRSSAALALGHYEDPQTLPILLDHLANDPSGGVRAMCAAAAGFSGDDAEMERYVEALMDPYENVRIAACWQFAHQQDRRAVDVIRGLVRDPNQWVRSSAASVLIRLGVIDEQVMDLLSGDESWEVRLSVVEELIKAEVADQRIVRAIERMMQEPDAQEHEVMMSEMNAFIESQERQDADLEPEEELSAEDEELIREMEESRPKPLAELLKKARRLVGEK